MQNKEEQKVVDDYIFSKKLGEGAFGKVYLTQKKGHKELYATKCLDLSKLNSKTAELLGNEINFLKKINHPNIVRLIDLKRTLNHAYLVMELCNGGELFGCLKKYREAHRRAFPEEIIQYIMRQVVNGLNFLHSNKIIHRDLKLQNILIVFNSENDKNSLNMMRAIAKISDLGFAKILEASKSSKTFTVLGTPGYMEPQIQKRHEENIAKTISGYDEKADIWSLGVLCYEMLLGYNPFFGNSSQEIMQKVKQGIFVLPKNISEEIFSFINGMLQIEPNKRLSAQELLRHSFLVKNPKQFKPLDPRKISTLIGQGGAMNPNDRAIKLNKTIWAVFVQPAAPNQNIGINQMNYGGNIYPQPQVQQVGQQQPFYGAPQVNIQNQYIQPGIMPNMQRGYI